MAKHKKHQEKPIVPASGVLLTLIGVADTLDATADLALQAVPYSCGLCGTPDAQCDADCVAHANGMDLVNSARRTARRLRELAGE